MRMSEVFQYCSTAAWTSISASISSTASVGLVCRPIITSWLKAATTCTVSQYDSQLFNYQVLTLVNTPVHTPHLLPSIFRNCFTPASSIHRYKIRHNKFYLTYVITIFGHRKLRYKASQLWDRLPNTHCMPILSE